MQSLNKLMAAAALLALFAFWSCSSPNHPAEPDVNIEAGMFTCVECHTDAVSLQALAVPEPPPSGEAGEG